MVSQHGAGVVQVSDKNLFAFLAMIRTAEGTNGPNGYRMLFGRGLFRSFADHPRIVVTKKSRGHLISSTAAGAYQILQKTWDVASKALGLTDFSPTSQDRVAAWLIKQAGAYRDVLAGRFVTATRKCNTTWASLPGSPYGQPTITMEAALAIYKAAGGDTVEEA